ncbi:hypothetical protein MRY82_08590 [bacterium]|nr:hypothetical protein [bacterium]
MLLKSLHEHSKHIQYEFYSTEELFKVLFLEKPINQTAIKKIIYRLNNNLVCDYEYLRYILDLDEDIIFKLLALIEMIKRKETLVSNLKYIHSPKDFALGLIKHCQYLVKEVVYIGLLNHKNVLFELKQLGQGETDSIKIDMKVFMKHILCEDASRIILGHNHPSGDPSPSHQDIALTKRIERMLSYFNLELLDHIIIGRKSYYSFKNKRICLIQQY